MDAPLVITGMHRSGTTLIASLLRERGVFLGSHLDPNLEDFFFLRRSEWLLRRAGGSWERPTPAREFLEDAEQLAEAQALFGQHVQSFAFRRFLGLGRYLRSGGKATPPWGWKDPRLVFTLPVWEAVFPGAKLIYIRRNGVDVAASLRSRNRARRNAKRAGEGRLYRRGLIGRMQNAWQGIEFHDHYLYAARESTLEAGFELWEQYVERGERLFAEYSGPKIALSFEELSSESGTSLAELASFAGLENAAEVGAAWQAELRPERANAFRTDPELRSFYDTVRDSRWMRELNYVELS